MPKQNLPQERTPVVVAQALTRLGEHISTARIRRRLTERELAQKTGLSLNTLRRVERGSGTTAISAYFTALWALGLEKEFEGLAAPERDLEGLTLELARAPKRVRGRKGLDADF
ncbi:MAG: multiprotein-bridging factor 1 family protein [Myxococcaceae bacterium]